METWVLKIGGAAVTHKQTNQRQARVDVIRRIAEEIRAAREVREVRLVVVHGAGPFGHGVVTDYGIAEEVRTPRQIEGFIRTHHSMRELNTMFLDIFLAAGLLVFPVQPSACLVQVDGRVASFFVEPLTRLFALDPRIIPLLHGDMVPDAVRGASVVSGDVLVAELGRRLGARRVLLGADVPGICTADPKLDPRARLVPRVDRDSLDAVLGMVGAAGTVDVTGGMRGKLTEIARTLAGLEVLIFDITAPGNLQRALSGEPVVGTSILL